MVTNTLNGTTATTNSSAATLTILPLTITTTSLPDGTVGTSYNSGSLSATSGVLPCTWSASGLPTGLNINTVTGVVYGRPITSGTFPVHLTVTDSVYASSSVNLNLVINPVPVSLTIITISLPDGIVGVSYNSGPLSAAGGVPPYTWSVSGLPNGLNINTVTGALCGTPTTSGTSSVQISVIDSVYASNSKNFSLIVYPVPSVTQITPSNGPTTGGTSVNITGTGLSTVSAVYFGNNAATNFTLGTDTLMSAVSPAGTGTVDVTVYGPGGTSATNPSDRFTYNNTVSYTVSFDSQGGNNVTSLTGINFGSTISEPTVPTKDGYTFGGWYKEASYVNAWNFSTDTVTGNITLYAKWAYNGGGGGGGGSGSSTPATSTYKADISGVGTTGTTLPINVNTNMGSAATDLGTVTGDIFSGTGTAVITVPSIPGVNSYTLEMPAYVISGSQGEGALTFSTGTGSITIPDNMLAELPETEGKKAGITIGQGDKSSLSDEVKTALGDRPLVQLTLTLDGVQTQWNNPNASVTVRIPYTPTAAELADPEYIVVWYIDGSGNAVSVPNGHYDAATGMVMFKTTHFSDYAVGYNKVSFNDVAPDAWYNNAVSFIAAREITGGTGNGNYSPEAKLTRGDFLVLLMNAYVITPDNNPADNFSDAGSTYYTGYLAAAKRLGISNGIGNNMFAPGKEITRQEMFTLMYNALKVINQLPQGTKLPDGSSGKTLSDFIDAGQIDFWAKDAMTLFVEIGTIGGNAGKLMPTGMTTRAEMAQVLYNLLSK
jgi:uncharacterized repeat protein (TIGR02543 family)